MGTCSNQILPLRSLNLELLIEYFITLERVQPIGRPALDATPSYCAEWLEGIEVVAKKAAERQHGKATKEKVFRLRESARYIRGHGSNCPYLTDSFWDVIMSLPCRSSFEKS